MPHSNNSSSNNQLHRHPTTTQGTHRTHNTDMLLHHSNRVDLMQVRLRGNQIIHNRVHPAHQHMG